MMTTRSQSEKVTKTSFDGEVKVAVKSVTNVEDVVNLAPAASRALQTKTKSAFRELEIATREFCFVKDSCFVELEDLHELGTCFALLQNVTLVLTDHSYSTRSAQGHASSASDVFCKELIKNAARSMSNVMAPEAQGLFFVSTCSSSTEITLRRHTELVPNMNLTTRGRKKGFYMSLK